MMILVIDDDASIRSSLSFMLKRAGYEVQAVATPAEALAVVRTARPDLILMDMNFSLSTTGEGVVVLSLAYLIVFYRSVVKPLLTIAGGMDLLREQDFSSRLRQVGQAEADRIVQIFNRMMDQLKAERLLLREQNHFLDLLIDASPMGVVLMSFDQELTHCNPAGLRMMGVALGDIQGKKLQAIHVPMAQELAQIPMGETRTIRLNDANIYKCSHSSFIDHGFPHSFYLIETLTNEVIKAEKRAYEKVIRLIAHEVNNTTAGIEVADNGKGISPEVEQKLFTPFFSTKPQGQGIGLIFIREVLTRHGCTFSLRTDPDGWTRFRIYMNK